MKNIDTFIRNTLVSLLEVDASELENQNTNLNMLGLTSMQTIQLIVMLEDEYNIEFLDNDLFFTNFSTFSKIKHLLAKYNIR